MIYCLCKNKVIVLFIQNVCGKRYQLNLFSPLFCATLLQPFFLSLSYFHSSGSSFSFQSYFPFLQFCYITFLYQYCGRHMQSETAYFSHYRTQSCDPFVQPIDSWHWAEGLHLCHGDKNVLFPFRHLHRPRQILHVWIQSEILHTVCLTDS